MTESETSIHRVIRGERGRDYRAITRSDKTAARGSCVWQQLACHNWHPGKGQPGRKGESNALCKDGSWLEGETVGAQIWSNLGRSRLLSLKAMVSEWQSEAFPLHSRKATYPRPNFGQTQEQQQHHPPLPEGPIGQASQGSECTKHNYEIVTLEIIDSYLSARVHHR